MKGRLGFSGGRVGGTEVSGKSHWESGESQGSVSGVWRVGEGTGLAVLWRSLASSVGWALARMGGSGSQ